MTAYITLYDATCSPGGRGRGLCLSKDPNFCPEFLLQSIFSLKMTTTKIPGTSPFYSFCRSGDHHFQNLCTCKPFHRHPRATAHLLRELKAKCFFSTPGLQLASVPAIRFLQISSRAAETPHFMFEPAPELHICKLEHAVEPCNFMLDLLQSPHFSLCCGTDLPQFGPRSLPLHPDASLQILD